MSGSMIRVILSVTFASLLAGCFFKPDTSGPTSSDSYDGPHRTRPLNEGGETKAVRPVAKPVVSTGAMDGATRPDQYIVYFDFDKSNVKSADADLLARHAAYLKANPGQKVVLEGHADERGTREYNIALGERRAKSVRSFLAARGVNAGNLEVVSFGEEKPAMTGANEGAWSKNRRVELRYK